MDKDGGTRWSANGGMPQWLQYRFASGKVINGYEFSAFNANPSQTPSSFTLQASNNGSNWTILDTQTGKSALNQYYIISNTVSYTYYRLYVTAVGGGGTTTVSLWEFILYSMPVLAVTAGGDVEYLVVAAGGAGGGSTSDTGGGGAGGMLTGSVTRAAGTYPVFVGKASGKDSIFSTLRTIGGGAGASISPGTGAWGGSGGGSVRNDGANPRPGGAGTPGQGNRGGNGYSTGYFTGGGGGAGGPGVDANGVALISAGGPGLTNSISGSPVPYAAGGKGYHRNASDPSGKGKAGDPNTGNGGNGGATGIAGGAGGSGIVIIRYALPPKGTLIMMR
jgi:hypothetical protein